MWLWHCRFERGQCKKVSGNDMHIHLHFISLKAQLRSKKSYFYYLVYCINWLQTKCYVILKLVNLMIMKVIMSIINTITCWQWDRWSRRLNFQHPGSGRPHGGVRGGICVWQWRGLPVWSATQPQQVQAPCKYCLLIK